ncbi:MAG: glycosyltransferase [Xenococcaceae cyanobacterium MO_188.B32]|nr:glycosyltransferase [Xenococcaceae cyanobacterium MO_188.B32]
MTAFNNKQKAKNLQPKFATLILAGIIILSAFIVALWAAGVGQIQDIFAYLNLLQQSPPMWVEAPMVMGEFLLTPTILLFLLALIVMKICPQPLSLARVLVIFILLGLTLRYVLWRSLSTLNLSSPLDGVFSISLFALELLVIFSSSLQLFLMLKVKNRQREAERLSTQVIEGKFQPTVDIFIPTYDEPEFILRRTVIGCQAINYKNKKIYLLDDTRRPRIKQLAAELGCEYLTRPDNLHAKAGNINHAIPLTEGEFIVIFDADFVPTRNFLERTLGFFEDKSVALVQTPQSFYNTDPIARNLGLEDVLTPEEEVFYRQLQPIKDAAGSVVCSGTSFVVKGTKNDRFSFNWKLASPLLILFVFTAISLWSNLCACALAEMHSNPEQMRGLNLGWIWSTYNLITIGTALLILLDVPKPDLHEWFNLRRLVKITLDSPENKQQIFWGVTTQISEVGADISLTQPGFPRLIRGEILPIQLSLLEEEICLQGKITETGFDGDFPTVKVAFAKLSLEQERKLVTLLFCRPGQWKRRNTPGELRSLWLLFKILLRPKVLFDRDPKINAIKVAQV